MTRTQRLIIRSIGRLAEEIKHWTHDKKQGLHAGGVLAVHIKACVVSNHAKKLLKEEG